MLDVNDFHPITAPQLSTANVAALIAKATEGDRFTAATFQQHRSAAKACGVPFGAYLYLDVRCAGGEAEHFLQVANLRSGDLRPIIDAEDLTQGVAALAERADACARVLEQHHLPPIMYGPASAIAELVSVRPELRRLPWWEAQYPGRFTRWAPPIARLRMRVQHGVSVVMWQWTDCLRLGRQTYDASRLFVPVSRLLIP